MPPAPRHSADHLPPPRPEADHAHRAPPGRSGWRAGFGGMLGLEDRDMISWESSTFIARPAEEVFAYVADVRNDPNWHKDVHSATVIKGSGELGAGTVF